MRAAKEVEGKVHGGKVKQNGARKVVSITLNVVFSVCMLFALYIVLIGKSESGTTIGPYGTAVILSGSMEPEIKTGSMIVTKRVPADELKVGDIITYKPIVGSEVLLTHRIIDISDEDSSFITQGDASEFPDPDRVHYDSIRGKLIYVVPLLGKLIIYLQVPHNLIIFIVLLVLCEVLWHVVSNLLTKPTDKSKKEITK